VETQSKQRRRVKQGEEEEFTAEQLRREKR